MYSKEIVDKVVFFNQYQFKQERDYIDYSLLDYIPKFIDMKDHDTLGAILDSEKDCV